MTRPNARDQMIAAAECIAVERGLGAMSLREVQAASGQRNKSAAQYHFGSRQGLIEAVVAARMGPVNDRRLAMLAALDAAPGEPSLRDLAAALVEPLAAATVATPGSHWARFLAQGVADPILSDVVRRNVEGRSYRDLRRRLLVALDHVPARLRERRVDQMVGLATASLAVAEEQLATTGRTRLPTDELVADLVDVCTAVLAVPSSVADPATAPHAPRSTHHAPA